MTRNFNFLHNTMLIHALIRIMILILVSHYTSLAIHIDGISIGIGVRPINSQLFSMIRNSLGLPCQLARIVHWLIFYRAQGVCTIVL